MDVENKNSTDQTKTTGNSVLETSNKGTLEDVVKSTLSQNKPLGTNQLSLKQNKQTVTCHPKAAGLPLGSPLVLGKRFQNIPNTSYLNNYPATTMQNIQNYPLFQNTQMPTQLGSFFNCLPGSLMGATMSNNNTICTKSKLILV